MGSRSWTIEDADQVAADVRGWLDPACTRTEVVGSVRRRRPRVGDVDLLVIERRDGSVLDRLLQLHYDELVHLRRHDDGTHRVVHIESGIPVDVHLTPAELWAHALVMRTGGKETIAALHEAAVARRYLLHDDGRIEVKTGQFKRVRSELNFFLALKAPWVAPEERA
jgi:DNA polymerase/3'-5' exonuclease PolX